MPKQLIRKLSEAKPDIWDADLLLFRTKGIVSRMIRRLGRGRHSHAAKASWIKSTLFCAEVREWHGGRLVTLESQVRLYPEQIDVFRVNAIEAKAYDREKADNLMLQFAGVEYGYLDILQTWAIHHFLRQANVDDDFVSKRPPYCSAACAIADRVGGGVDPVPMLADNETEPSDLARSPFYKYLFTLAPDDAATIAGCVPETNEAAKTMADASNGAKPVSVTTIVAEQEESRLSQ